MVETEGLNVLEFFRYVDEVRNVTFALSEGWRWENGRFEFSSEWEVEDLASHVSDQARTTAELCKAMSSLVEFLNFEGEESGMFENMRLPTLDTEIWWDGNYVRYSFYEKPQCPNRVLQRERRPYLNLQFMLV